MSVGYGIQYQVSLNFKSVFLMIMVVKVKVAQSRPILGDPMDCTVHEILQARILEWVTFPFSRGSLQCRDRTQVSHYSLVVLHRLLIAVASFAAEHGL